MEDATKISIQIDDEKESPMENEEVPKNLRELPSSAQKIWKQKYEEALKITKDVRFANDSAWGELNKFFINLDGSWLPRVDVPTGETASIGKKQKEFIGYCLERN
ncbi:MAG: ChaB family protein [Nanoarchaeota archaeon]|nr:ChaB family protein [Nanoarchaeota archaeon]